MLTRKNRPRSWYNYNRLGVVNHHGWPNNLIANQEFIQQKYWCIMDSSHPVKVRAIRRISLRSFHWRLLDALYFGVHGLSQAVESLTNATHLRDPSIMYIPLRHRKTYLDIVYDDALRLQQEAKLRSVNLLESGFEVLIAMPIIWSR